MKGLGCQDKKLGSHLCISKKKTLPRQHGVGGRGEAQEASEEPGAKVRRVQGRDHSNEKRGETSPPRCPR